ncbi:MAG: hypothetical protein M1825_003341 [Sarcosagium campestre]|nr:MAG: hypothetical protein M1825_003341 [Sarcosagium campestre]
MESKRVTMHSTNLTFSQALSVRETVTYESCPDEPDAKTQFRQDAQIIALCGGWQKVKNRIEEYTCERFGQNARTGKEGFEAVLEMSRRVFGEQREREREREMIVGQSP